MVQTGCEYVQTFPELYEDEAGCEAGGGWQSCRKRLEPTSSIFRF